jgi:hypothetical protein
MAWCMGRWFMIFETCLLVPRVETASCVRTFPLVVQWITSGGVHCLRLLGLAVLGWLAVFACVVLAGLEVSDG